MIDKIVRLAAKRCSDYTWKNHHRGAASRLVPNVNVSWVLKSNMANLRAAGAVGAGNDQHPACDHGWTYPTSMSSGNSMKLGLTALG
jgi:hypothetical protein